MTEKLFDGFPYTSSEEWIARIRKDLKGKTLEEMFWSPDGDLNISPFVHAEDVSTGTASIGSFGKWQIMESFDVADARETNLQILEALNGGVESLHIACDDKMVWDVLLAKVELPLIHVCLEIRGDAHDALRSFYAYAGIKYQADNLSVSLQCTNQESPIPWIDEFPGMRISIGPHTTGQIAEGLYKTIYDTLAFGEWNPDRLSKCDLSVMVGMHYLVEISRLRALRVLWTDVSSALKFPLSPSFTIEARTAACSPDDDQYAHMIRGTVMSLAALLGGADRIDIQPARGTNHSSSFYRRIPRNMHHLLRMESKFSEITDPVAGAYYIDKLSRDLREKAWEMLVPRMKT